MSAAALRGVRFHGPGDVRLEPVIASDPAPGEVRLRPAAVGICGTDAKIVEGSFHAVPGTVLGHEIAGHVEAVGAGVETLLEGDLVSVEPHLYCGQCRYCRRGLEHLCPLKRAFGVHLDGGMADAVTLPARIAYRVDPSIDPAIACLAEPLGCAVHGMDRLAPTSGLPVLVIGAGPAGLMLTALSSIAGLAPIVVVDPAASRRDAATALGADATIDPSGDDWHAQALALTNGDGYDHLIEASGRPEGLADALALTARAARILVYGVARPGEVTAVQPQQVYAKELTILGAALNPFTHARAVELLTELPLGVIEAGRYPLERFEEAFEAQRRRAHLKVVMTP